MWSRGFDVDITFSCRSLPVNEWFILTRHCLRCSLAAKHKQTIKYDIVTTIIIIQTNKVAQYRIINNNSLKA